MHDSNAALPERPLDARTSAGRASGRVAPRVDELVVRHFALLASPRACEEKSRVAARICAHLDEMATLDSANAIHVERPTFERIAREATRTAARVLDHGARTDGETLRSVQVFVAACQSLLGRVLDVRNFDKEAAHGLFAVVESSVLVQVLRDLGDARPTIGQPRDHEVENVHSFVKHGPLDRDATLAANIALALSEFPVAHLSDIVGFVCALLHAVAALSFRRQASAPYRRAWRDLRRFARSYADAAGVRHEETRRGVLRGARTFALCVDLLNAGANGSIAATKRRAIRIFEEKARYAMLHHKNESLGGRRLVEWFSDKPFRAEEMMTALRDSPWINQHDVNASRFFSYLTCRGGKMDGVFSPSEIEVLKSHLSASPEAADGDDAGALWAGFLDSADRPDPEDTGPSTQRSDAPPDDRVTFFQLLDAEAQRSAISLAHRTVAKSLAEMTALRRLRSGPSVFDLFEYDRHRFDERISQIYWHQSEVVQRMNLELDVEQLRKFHLYFAPFALIDGCWLRNAVATRAGNDVRLALYGIYSDEIGNGHYEYNHANIYGRLMGELGWPIASVNDLSFASTAEIPMFAFKAPAFLLALSLAHADYFPELLGVTLAVELSGLDGLYEAMIANLEVHKYAASFWRLHVSVDNYSTGHARQSLDACIDYMEETKQGYGAAVATIVWERVWSGFLTMLYLFDVELRTLLGVKSKKS